MNSHLIPNRLQKGDIISGRGSRTTLKHGFSRESSVPQPCLNTLLMCDVLQCLKGDGT